MHDKYLAAPPHRLARYSGALLPPTPLCPGQLFHQQLLINLDEAGPRCRGRRFKGEERGEYCILLGWGGGCRLVGEKAGGENGDEPGPTLALSREGTAAAPNPNSYPYLVIPKFLPPVLFLPSHSSLKGFPAHPLTLLFTTDQKARRMPCHSRAQKETRTHSHTHTATLQIGIAEMPHGK